MANLCSQVQFQHISDFLLQAFEQNISLSLEDNGCLNSDISKYGHLKEKCVDFHLQIQSSKCDDIQS